MSACPCCLEDLRRPFLGLGGRQLAGPCDVCGEAVCECCLHTALLEAGALGARAAAVAGGAPQRRVRARACSGCLYTLHLEHGETPPFDEPAGLARRRAQAACAHARRARHLGFCPDCGAAAGEAEREDPECDGCGAPSHERFNCCFACGESFGEDHAPEEGAEGYVLEADCDARDCSGQVAAHMAHCPWCGAAQRWAREAGDVDCGACDALVEATWSFCAACGEEAALPECCTLCAGRLEAAACAARCEACRRMVCGECFAHCTPPDAPAELLLCSACSEDLGAVPRASNDDAPAEDGDVNAAPPPAAPSPEPEQRESPWEVLGVAPGTPLPEVKRAYLGLVAQYHPDKVAQLGPKLQRLALEETRRLNLAWSELRERGG